MLSKFGKEANFYIRFMRVCAQRISASQLSISFTIVALILGSYSVWRAKFIIGDLGFISSLPITYFVALGFLLGASALLWTSHEDHSKLLGLQTCLLIFALWLGPFLIVGSYPLRTDHPYIFWGNTDYILRHGHFTPPDLWYLEWPAIWTLSATVFMITGLSNDIIIYLTPIALQFLFVIALFVFLKNTLGRERKNYIWAGLCIFCLGNWIPQSYLGAQSFGYFFFLVLLALISKTSAWQRGTLTFAQILYIILIFASLTITHLFSSLAGLVAIIALFVRRNIKDITIVILAIVLIASWTIYGATGMAKTNIPGFLANVFRIDKLFSIGVGERTAIGSSGHQMVVWLKILNGLWVLAIAAAGFILVRKPKRNGYDDSTVWALGVGIVLFAIAMGVGYGFELPQRIFILTLPVAGYFGIKLLNLKLGAIFLYLLILPLLPLFFVSTYGNIAIDTLSQAEIAGMHSFLDHAVGGTPIGLGMEYGTMKNAERFSGISYEYLQEVGWSGDEIAQPWLLYVAISRHDESTYTFYNKPEYIPNLQARLDSTTDCNLFYINPDTRLYIHEPTP